MNKTLVSKSSEMVRVRPLVVEGFATGSAGRHTQRWCGRSFMALWGSTGR